MPVNEGLFKLIFVCTAVAIASNSALISVPLTSFDGLPVVSVSFTAKLVAFT